MSLQSFSGSGSEIKLVPESVKQLPAQTSLHWLKPDCDLFRPGTVIAFKFKVYQKLSFSHFGEVVI